MDITPCHGRYLRSRERPPGALRAPTGSVFLSGRNPVTAVCHGQQGPPSPALPHARRLPQAQEGAEDAGGPAAVVFGDAERGGHVEVAGQRGADGGPPRPAAAPAVPPPRPGARGRSPSPGPTGGPGSAAARPPQGSR